MNHHDVPRIALAPDPAPEWLAEAIGNGGGQVVDLASSEVIV